MGLYKREKIPFIIVEEYKEDNGGKSMANVKTADGI